MERPIRGEQLGSFEAVFSDKGSDGEPEKLWNRDTGAINPTVVKEWKKFDINLILKDHWAELSPKLKGKIHVYCGTEDTFYLDGAVKKLQGSLKSLGSDAEVELRPGNHFTVLTKDLRLRISKEIADRYRATR
jgi:S-formylglutathione hydrolase FrmB